jgi:hypothetical protein
LRNQNFPRAILTFFLLALLIGKLNAQQYSFYGVLMLNGKKENSITYRLDFTEKDGKITGTSTTDLTGKHETKNVISGTYNNKTMVFSFVEKEMIYTKSPVNKNDFCFVHYTSKIGLTSKNAQLEGEFKGYYKNNQPCIDGTLKLIGSSAIDKLLSLAERKIEKSKELDDETKKEFNPKVLFDSLQTQQLTTGESLNIFFESDQVTFTIWDKNKEDGDIITLKHNAILVLQNYTVKNQAHQISMRLMDGENVFTIEALNEGSIAPNTAMIILEGDQTIEFQSNLRKGEKATVRILRKNR